MIAKIKKWWSRRTAAPTLLEQALAEMAMARTSADSLAETLKRAQAAVDAAEADPTLLSMHDHHHYLSSPDVQGWCADNRITYDLERHGLAYFMRFENPESAALYRLRWSV